MLQLHQGAASELHNPWVHNVSIKEIPGYQEPKLTILRYLISSNFVGGLNSYGLIILIMAYLK
jgi:hypothetical protein